MSAISVDFFFKGSKLDMQRPIKKIKAVNNG